VPYIALVWVVDNQRHQGIGRAMHCTALRRPMNQSPRHGTGTSASKSVALSRA
jgi:hypothetical protein